MPSLAAFRQLFAFYRVAVVNTVFGYSLYALLVYFKIDPYVAQVLSHLAGMTFNFFMYSHHVFRGAEASVLRYVAAYGLNYGLSVGFLALFNQLFSSRYLNGFLAMLAASLINFAVLKLAVFRKRAVAEAEGSLGA